MCHAHPSLPLLQREAREVKERVTETRQRSQTGGFSGRGSRGGSAGGGGAGGGSNGRAANGGGRGKCVCVGGVGERVNAVA